MNKCALRVCVLLGIFFLFPGPLFGAEYSVKKHQAVRGESIRSLLLGSNCITSINDYARAREAFGELNPGIFHSDLLAPGRTAFLPIWKRKSGSDCLAYREQRIVRVEFEALSFGERLRVYLDGPVVPDLFVIRDTPPMRVVCDFDGTRLISNLPRDIRTKGRMIHGLRIGYEDKPQPRSRIVLDLDDALTGRVEQEFFEKESIFVITVFEGS